MRAATIHEIKQELSSVKTLMYYWNSVCDWGNLKKRTRSY
jgi:hypothetical protein